jgi:hypothetical protein
MLWMKRMDGAPPPFERSTVHKPFPNLKSFAWYGPGVEDGFVWSVLDSSPLLEEFSILCPKQLPLGLIAALARRGETLTTLHLTGNDLTDADMREIGQHCKNLTTLQLTGNVSPNKLITDAGIAAIAVGCTKLTKVNLFELSVTAAALTALFTHCIHLREVSCRGLGIHGAAVQALGNPARMTQITALTCIWGVTTPLSAADYARAFSGVTSMHLTIPALTNARSLHAALREMCSLQTLSFVASYFWALPASVLNAAAEGTCVLEYLYVEGRLSGSTESGLVAIAQRNPKLTRVNLQRAYLAVTDSVLHALSEHCTNLSILEVSNAASVTDASVVALARGCPVLRGLALRRCSCLTDRSILALAEHAHLLSHLDVSDSHRITQPALEQLLQQARAHMFLEVSAASISRAEAERLERMYHGITPARGHTILAHMTASIWLAEKVRAVGRALSGCGAAPVVADYAAVPPVQV